MVDERLTQYNLTVCLWSDVLALTMIAFCCPLVTSVSGIHCILHKKHNSQNVGPPCVDMMSLSYTYSSAVGATLTFTLNFDL